MTDMAKKTEWVQFTKRTDEPKLNYLEHRLDEAGIPHRRNGRSWHAPIMEIQSEFNGKAWKIMSERWRLRGDEVGAHPRGRTTLDDIPDDDERFIVWKHEED
jgi:hypothetical protein